MYKIVLVLLCCLLYVGCREVSLDKGPPNKFYYGTIVKNKLDNKKGTIISLRRSLIGNTNYIAPFPTESHIQAFSNGEWEYLIRFPVDKTLGVDTAAGSGFLGDAEHYPPTMYVKVWFLERELEEANEN